MTRISTSNYAGDPSTTFMWATSGSDRFSRVDDLYNLAQALELHDHTAGKGLAAARAANASITTAMLQAGAVDASRLGVDAVTAIAVALDAIGALELANNAVDTAAIQDAAVTGVKLAATAIQDSLGYIPASVAGTTFGGTIRAPRFDTQSAAFPTTNDWSIYDNSLIGLEGSLIIQKRLSGSPAIQFNPTTGEMTVNGSPPGVPLGAILAFDTAAELAAAGASWSAHAASAGRILVGAGTTDGVTFIENASTGGNWKPGTSLGVGVGTLRVQNGSAVNDVTGANIRDTAAVAYNAGSAVNLDLTHHHVAVLSGSGALTGQGTAWVPPMRVVVYGKKTS